LTADSKRRIDDAFRLIEQGKYDGSMISSGICVAFRTGGSWFLVSHKSRMLANSYARQPIDFVVDLYLISQPLLTLGPDFGQPTGRIGDVGGESENPS